MKANLCGFIWTKICPKCRKSYEAPSLKGFDFAFRKDPKRIDLLDPICKSCRKAYRAQNRKKENACWRKYYAAGTENRKRHDVRTGTRRKYGSAKKHDCSICESPATEWHHLEYQIDSAIPVCSECHEKF